jgi:hypothetical protein
MTAPSTDHSKRLTELLARELAASVARDYRIDISGAIEQIAPLVESNRALQEALGEKRDVAEIRRLRVFKDLEKRARRQVYNHLRRYKLADDEMTAAVNALERLPPGQEAYAAAGAIQAICAAHVSTAERLGSLHDFQTMLATHCAHATSILDIGAGVEPLLFPFGSCAPLESYLALDRDRLALRAIAAFARWSGLSILETREWSISNGWDSVVKPDGKTFDVALLLKVIPVVARQKPRLFDILAQTPARMLIITGSKEALAKRNVIMQRERSTLRSFVDRYGFTVHDSFETSDEIGMLLGR